MKRAVGFFILCRSKPVRNYNYFSSTAKPRTLIDDNCKNEREENEDTKRSLNAFDRQPISHAHGQHFKTNNLLKDVIRDDNRKMLHVQWSNGLKGRFLYVWLRDNCPEAHTYNLSSICKARMMLMNDLNVEIEPLTVENLGDKIYILWPDNKPAYYESKWLEERNLDDFSLRAKRTEVNLDDKDLWNCAQIKKRMKWTPYEKLMSDDLILHDTLTTLCKSGVVFIDNVPIKQGQLNELASKIGFEYLTHYGHFFVVKNNENPTNLAYRRGALGFHTDLPYMQYAPQVQALHCVEQVKSKGGENQLVDAFYVANEMAVKYPEFFKILCTVPIEYIDDGRDFIRFDLTYSRPVFNFDSKGRLAEVHFSNQQRSWFYDVPVEQLLNIYRAQKTFNNLLYSPEHKLELKLQPGQMIIFHNLRVLHARSAFEDNDNERRLMEGCYFNLDIIKSKIRVLRDQLNLQPNQISV